MYVTINDSAVCQSADCLKGNFSVAVCFPSKLRKIALLLLKSILFFLRLIRDFVHKSVVLKDNFLNIRNILKHY